MVTVVTVRVAVVGLTKNVPSRWSSSSKELPVSLILIERMLVSGMSEWRVCRIALANTFEVLFRVMLMLMFSLFLMLGAQKILRIFCCTPTVARLREFSDSDLPPRPLCVMFGELQADGE